VVKAKMSNVRGGRMWEPHFRPQERLEDLELERHNMESSLTKVTQAYALTQAWLPLEVRKKSLVV